MKQSEVLDTITKIKLAHQAMESACKRVDELKEENKNLKEALAKQEQRSDSEHTGEPVAYLVTGPYEKQPFANINSAKAYREGLNKGFGEDAYTISNLYTTPQQPSTIVRKPLTDEQIVSKAMHLSGLGTSPDVLQFARAIEAAHGIKGNT
jgi:hypothetical protein